MLAPSLAASWKTTYRFSMSRSDSALGRGELSLGSSADPRRVAEARDRRFGTHGLALSARQADNTVTNLAYIPCEPPRQRDVRLAAPVARDRDYCDSGHTVVLASTTHCAKVTFARRASRRGVLIEIGRLVVRIAQENPTWSYTRIQGAHKNLGHRVGRSTIARILKAAGVPPVPERPTSWQTFLRAHWGVIGGTDFFTTDVWTWRGLVTYYTVFVIDLASRRVQILGSTPYPNDLFMRQVGRTLSAADGRRRDHRFLICDRDQKWSGEVRCLLHDAGICVVQTPPQAPNANAHAERFVGSIKECLNRVIPIGERHFRRAMHAFVEHYHRERNHQGLDNELIDGHSSPGGAGRIRCRQRLGGLLNYYYRAA